ncbi:MAG: FAD-dependent 5-carboxymethylaminomethyl-2-thiouridine(34) oxidoreductase MnmC [Pseudomonadota bacterium]|jgi:tRNA 5-methylaminomethyl-2-thiouridine biosynthesis bifunctional protein
MNVDVAIVGAGLAGGLSAFALARRGLRVAVIDRAPHLAAKGSGNLFAILTPYLSTTSSPLETLYSLGYAFTQNLLRCNPACSTSFRKCGALHLPSTKRLAQLLQSDRTILSHTLVQRVSPTEASSLAGTAVRSMALHIPDAGFISPRSFIEGLLTEVSPHLDLLLETEFVSLTRQDASWQVSCSNRTVVNSSAVVLCGAYEAATLPLSAWLPLEAIRGQTACLSENSTLATLRCVLAYGGYLTPGVGGIHLIGAHYSHGDDETSPRATDTETMINDCNDWLPELLLTRHQVTAERVCFRTSTLDRLPYIGALPDFVAFKEACRRYRSGTDLRSKITISTLPGLFVSVGHGSRGLLSAPIGGEIIARLITGEPLGELAAAAETTAPSRLPWRLSANHE